MKKISKETGNIRFSGNAGIDSICLRAHRVNGSFSLLRNSVVAHINKEGEIICADETSYIDEKKSAYKRIGVVDKKYENIFKKASTTMFIMTIVISFVFSQSYVSNLISALFLFVWACYLSSGSIGLFIEKVKKNKEILGILKFHSAEHAVINAYHDLNRVPTLEEIRNYSNYSYNCGSLSEIKKFVVMATISVVRLIPNPMLSLVAMLIILLIFVFIPESKFFFMQFLVTAEPTDREYQVAIKGIDYALQGLETKFPKNDTSYMEKIMIFIEAMQGGHKFSEEICQYCPNYSACKQLFGNK